MTAVVPSQGRIRADPDDTGVGDVRTLVVAMPLCGCRGRDFLEAATIISLRADIQRHDSRGHTMACA